MYDSPSSVTIDVDHISTRAEQHPHFRMVQGEITARAVTLEQFLHRGSTEGQQQAPGASLLPLHSMHSGRTDPLPRQGEQTGTAASRPQPQLQQGPDPVPGRLPLPPTKDRDVWCFWSQRPHPHCHAPRISCMHARENHFCLEGTNIPARCAGSACTLRAGLT